MGFVPGSSSAFDASSFVDSAGKNIWGGSLSLFSYNGDGPPAEAKEKSDPACDTFFADAEGASFDTGSASNSSGSNMGASAASTVQSSPQTSLSALTPQAHAPQLAPIGMGQQLQLQKQPAAAGPSPSVVAANGTPVMVNYVAAQQPVAQQAPQQPVVLQSMPAVQPQQMQQQAQQPSAGGKRIRGLVKRWNIEKGYGFLQPVDGGDDVFVHHSVIHAQGFRSLHEGSEVEYEAVEVGPGRVRAANVTGPESSFVQAAKRPPNLPVVPAGQGLVPIQLPPGATLVPSGSIMRMPQQQQQQQPVPQVQVQPQPQPQQVQPQVQVQVQVPQNTAVQQVPVQHMVQHRVQVQHVQPQVQQQMPAVVAQPQAMMQQQQQQQQQIIAAPMKVPAGQQTFVISNGMQVAGKQIAVAAPQQIQPQMWQMPQNMQVGQPGLHQQQQQPQHAQLVTKTAPAPQPNVVVARAPPPVLIN